MGPIIILLVIVFNNGVADTTASASSDRLFFKWYNVSVPTSGTLFIKNIFFSSSIISVNDVALNIRKLITTITDVYMYFITLVLSKYFFKNFFSITRITPKYNPQKIKFQLAPCQNPVKNQTTKMFLIHFKLLTRFPPSGI